MLLWYPEYSDFFDFVDRTDLLCTISQSSLQGKESFKHEKQIVYYLCPLTHAFHAAQVLSNSPLHLLQIN